MERYQGKWKGEKRKNEMGEKGGELARMEKRG